MTASAADTSFAGEGRLPAVLFSAFLFTTFIGFSPIIVGAPDAGFVEEEGNGLRQLVFTLLFASIAGTLIYRRGARDLLNVPVPLMVLLAWCSLSITWAIEPGVSARRVVFTIMIALSVTYSVNMLKDRVVMQIVTIWFGLILILDWMTIPLVAQAVHQPNEVVVYQPNEVKADPALVGNWRGIHPHKNEAGPFCAVVALIFADMIARRLSYITAPIMVALALAFLFMTESKTAFGLVFFSAGLGMLMVLCYNNSDLRKILLVAVFCLLFVVVLAADKNSLALLAWFEDPSSLTGRVQIWPVLLQYASDHLLLGSGYGSFWAIGSASPIFESTLSWATQAHNGYIDLLVQIGVVGLGLAVAALVAHPLYVLFTKSLLPPPSRWLMGAILTFCWLHDLLETSLLDRVHPLWVILLIFYNLLLRQSKTAESTKADLAGKSVAQVRSPDAYDQA